MGPALREGIIVVPKPLLAFEPVAEQSGGGGDAFGAFGGWDAFGAFGGGGGFGGYGG